MSRPRTDIVAEFKKSGEYDKLRKELLIHFQKSDGIESFKSKIEENVRELMHGSDEIRRELLTSNVKQSTHRTLLDEVERFPTLERAVLDHAMFTDPVFLKNIYGFVERAMDEDNGTSKEKGKGKATNEESKQDTVIEGSSSSKKKDVEDSLPAKPSPDADAAQNTKAPSNLSIQEAPGPISRDTTNEMQDVASGQ